MRLLYIITGIVCSILIPLSLQYFGFFAFISRPEAIKVPLSVFYSEDGPPFRLSAEATAAVKKTLSQHAKFVESASLYIEPHHIMRRRPDSGSPYKDIHAFTLSLTLTSGDTIDVRHRTTRSDNLPCSICDAIRECIEYYQDLGGGSQTKGKRRTFTLSSLCAPAYAPAYA